MALFIACLCKRFLVLCKNNASGKRAAASRINYNDAGTYREKERRANYPLISHLKNINKFVIKFSVRRIYNASNLLKI